MQCCHLLGSANSLCLWLGGVGSSCARGGVLEEYPPDCTELIKIEKLNLLCCTVSMLQGLGTIGMDLNEGLLHWFYDQDPVQATGCMVVKPTLCMYM